jgi:hypothetical protein
MEFIMKNLRNTLLTLLLVALGSTNLVAMNCTHGGDLPEAPAEKRLKTTTKSFTIECRDGTKIPNIPLCVVVQSGTIKNMLDDLGNLENAPENLELPVYNIDSGIMRIMLKYMKFVTHAQAQNCSQRQIIVNLASMIKAITFKFYKPQTILNLLDVANYLDFQPFYIALNVVLAQNYKHLIEHWKIDNIIPDHVANFQKIYLLFYNKQLDVGSRVTISINDLVDFEMVAPECQTQSMASVLTDIFEGNLDADKLQDYLDAISSFSCFTQLSTQAHKALVDCLRGLTQAEMQQFFNQLVGSHQTTLKMALQLICAQKYQHNLDPHLDCVHFITNIHNWVNWATNEHYPHGGHTQLFSQANLLYVLPLLEGLIGASVIKLDLYGNQLTCLPDSIGNLVNLQGLYLYSNQLTCLPDSIGNLVNLQKLYLTNNRLTNLPDSIGNLVNLQELWLYQNNFSPKVNQALRVQFGYLKDFRI